jgi:hypothetical protein
LWVLMLVTLWLPPAISGVALGVATCPFETTVPVSSVPVLFQAERPLTRLVYPLPLSIKGDWTAVAADGSRLEIAGTLPPGWTIESVAYELKEIQSGRPMSSSLRESKSVPGQVNLVYQSPINVQEQIALGLEVRIRGRAADGATSMFLGHLAFDLRHPPVVLVPGIWSDLRSFEQMKVRLFQLGFQHLSLFVAAMDPTLEPEIMARRLQDLLRDPRESPVAAARKSGLLCQKVDLIGHGLGGLIVRHLLAGNPGSSIRWQEKVRAVVTLGTPHAGIPRGAETPERAVAAAAMVTGSSFLNRLHSSESADPKVRYYFLYGDKAMVASPTVASPTDGLVPVMSAKGEASGILPRAVRGLFATHHELPLEAAEIVGLALAGRLDQTIPEYTICRLWGDAGLHAYDLADNHVGRQADGIAHSRIPGARYFPAQAGAGLPETILVPDSSLIRFEVRGQTPGTFSLDLLAESSAGAMEARFREISIRPGQMFAIDAGKAVLALSGPWGTVPPWFQTTRVLERDWWAVWFGWFRKDPLGWVFWFLLFGIGAGISWFWHRQVRRHRVPVATAPGASVVDAEVGLQGSVADDPRRPDAGHGVTSRLTHILGSDRFLWALFGLGVVFVPAGFWYPQFFLADLAVLGILWSRRAYLSAGILLAWTILLPALRLFKIIV